MPDLRTHLYYDTILFGPVLTAQYGFVNAVMDRPWHRLFGKQHRTILHNQDGIEEIGRRFGPWAAKFAQLHIYVDTLFTQIKL